MKHFFARLSLCVVCCAVMASCAAPTSPTAMVPAGISTRKFNKTVVLAVTGGEETKRPSAFTVSNQDFAAAIQSTIEQNDVFSRVFRSGNADYRLEVRLIELDRPMMGFSMTVTADVSWRVREAQSDRLVWHKNIRRSHTTGAGEAFVGVKRLKLAIEGAMRESIKAGLEEISKLPL